MIYPLKMPIIIIGFGTILVMNEYSNIRIEEEDFDCEDRDWVLFAFDCKKERNLV